MAFWDFFKDLFTYLFLEREEGREKERERNINVWLPLMHVPPTGDLACNPGMWQPFSSQASTQSTDPYQPGLAFCFNQLFIICY